MRYGCLTNHPEDATQCPLSTTNPPDAGTATCQNGGNSFWYIHVGGKRTDWNQGTDALCLDEDSRIAQWGGSPCQYAVTEEMCKCILYNAGCQKGQHTLFI